MEPCFLRSGRPPGGGLDRLSCGWAWQTRSSGGQGLMVESSPCDPCRFKTGFFSLWDFAGSAGWKFYVKKVGRFFLFGLKLKLKVIMINIIPGIYFSGFACISLLLSIGTSRDWSCMSQWVISWKPWYTIRILVVKPHRGMVCRGWVVDLWPSGHT